MSERLQGPGESLPDAVSCIKPLASGHINEGFKVSITEVTPQTPPSGYNTNTRG